MRRVIVLAILLVMTNLLVGCDGKPAASSTPPAPPVTVARPLQKTVTEWNEFTGRFVAVGAVRGGARGFGLIRTIQFKGGPGVKHVGLPFVIRPRPYKL